MALLERLNKKLGKPVADPLQEVLDTPKHESKGGAGFGAGRPLSPEDVNAEEPEEVNPYSIPLEDIEQELQDEDSEDNPPSAKEVSTLRAERKDFLLKQARRIVRRVNDLQILFIELVLDIEETEEFEITPDEMSEILECLPDVMEEQGIELPPTADLGITLAFMVLRRVKLAIQKKKDKKRATMSIA